MISDIIRKYRSDKGYSRERLARILGVDKMTIYHWENGTRKPSFQNIINICFILNLSMDLAFGHDDHEKKMI